LNPLLLLLENFVWESQSMGKFLMPSLGSDMESGVLIEWEKHPGDAVERGDVIAVVETDKGAIEIEVFETGVLDSVLVQPGEKVAVGTPLALIKTAETSEIDTDADSARQDNCIEPSTPARGSEIESPSFEVATGHQEPTASLIPSTSPIPASAATLSGARIRVTPAARKLADELAIDLSSLSASGPDGAILLADVRATTNPSSIGEKGVLLAATTANDMASIEPEHIQSDTPVDKKNAVDRMRYAIAAAMSRSKREIPHYYLSHSVDIGAAIDFIGVVNAAREPADRLLLSALLIKSVARTIIDYGEFNGHYEHDAYVSSDTAHIGMAINIRGGGLVAPAIHGADQLTVDETMQRLRDLVNRVRKGRFRASELNDPTITISSLGERGVRTLFGVIYPPQVAIIGFGTPAEEAVVKDGEVVIATMMNMTLAADHRVSDGHRGALFLNAIARNLQSPEQL
jgi:pyruvate dehydrogenase E2 component (dihydrolipoamide acetyltransferase)